MKRIANKNNIADVADNVNYKHTSMNLGIANDVQRAEECDDVRNNFQWRRQ